MATPRTIEELLKMKPCPFEDGQRITHDLVLKYRTASDVSSEVMVLAENAYLFNKPFKMPDGYYHLPPDKQLGLPLGEWTWRELAPLIYSLSFGVLMKYTRNITIAGGEDGGCLISVSFETMHRVFNIHKQPPNLYNPLDQQEEEAQPAKETETMELPLQDINNKIQGLEKRFITLEDMLSPCTSAIAKAPTVEVPVEPEKEPVNLYGRWVYDSNDFWYIDPAHPKVLMSCHKKSTEKWGLNTLQLIMTLDNFEIKVWATSPEAWLAWKAEQEGNI